MKFKEFQHLGEHGDFYSEMAEVVERHTLSDRSAWWAERLISHGVLNGFRVYHRSKDIDALAALGRAIGEIQKNLSEGGLSPLASEYLFSQLHSGPFSEAFHKGGFETDSPEGKEFLAYLSEYGRRDSALLSDIVERAASLRQAVNRTIKGVECSPLTKVSPSRVNVQGIAIVEATRFIWELSSGRRPPTKDLNPASKFGNFLADVLDVCDIDGDPKSIFRAWVREEEKKVHR